MEPIDTDGSQRPTSATTSPISPRPSQPRPAETRAVRFPEVDELYEVEIIDNRRTQNVTCRGCSKYWTNQKFDRMLKHLNKCKETLTTKKDIVLALNAKVELHAQKKLESTTTNLAKVGTLENKVKLDQLVVRFIATNNLPISVVDKPSFKNLVRALDNRYTPPTRKSLTYNLLPQMANQCSEASLKKMRSSEDYSITIEFDGWSSAGNAILAILLTGDDGNSLMVDLMNISHVSHRGELLAGLVLEAVKKTGLKKEKINSVLSDEASNCRLAREKICDLFPDDHLIQHRCMAHVFNLVGGLISKTEPIEGHLKAAMKLINTVGRSKLLSSKLKELGGRRLVNVVPTRWYSTCAAINSLLRAKQYLNQIPNSREFNPTEWQPLMRNSEFWSGLTGCKVYFDRLASIIGKAESKVSSLSSSFKDFLEFCKFVMKNHDLMFREVAIRGMIYHFNKLDLPLMFAAYMVNPNYKTDYLRAKAIEMGKEKLAEILFGVHSNEVLATVMMGEFEGYIDQPITERVVDVLGWWKRSRKPVLAGVSKRLLSLRASSANTERLFSLLNAIATPKRNMISCSTLSDLACINVYEHNLLTCDENDDKSLDAASQPLSGDEEDVPCVEETPGTYLFDPRILEEAGQTEMSADFYSNKDYKNFTELIDFNACQPTFCPPENNEEPRRDSREMAKRFMSRYSSQ